MLENIALFVIVMLLITFTAAIVFIGSLPGKIARGRNHPCPDAVNAASWIGLATGVLWPLAFIWAFLPVPSKPSDASVDAPDRSENVDPSDAVAELQKRLTDLEAAMRKLQSQSKEKAK